MKNILKIILMIGLIGLISSNLSMATSKNLILRTDNNTIKIGENFKIYVDIGNIKVASYNYSIYFDNKMVEYISDSDNNSDNTNVVENKIISVWYDLNGGKTPKVNKNIASFEFLAKSEGIANFNIEGEFFDENGNKLDISNTNVTINIEKLDENTQNEQVQEIEEKSKSNNSLLKIMRLDKEGITPEFSPNIKEYYFIADLNISSLEVTAIPENTKASISITGNKNLKEGLNTIIIKVTSEDLSSISEYKINVTKTGDKEAANSNLEMLAIENTILEPIFEPNIFNYKAEVSDDVEKLNILAIPENIQSTVEITGNENLQVGDNKININVKAPNEYSYKNYEIIVHKRTKEEQTKKEQKEENNAQKLSVLLNENGEAQIEQQEENVNNINDRKNSNNTLKILVSVIAVLTILIIIVLSLRKIKSTPKKQ